MKTTAEARFLEVLKRLTTLQLKYLPEDIKLSRPAIALISWIGTFPGYGVVDIADGLGLSPPTISVGIRRLVKAGWLERRKDPDDGRSQHIFLTPKGDALMHRIQAYQKKEFSALLAALSQDEQNLLLGFLEHALESITEPSKKPMMDSL